MTRTEKIRIVQMILCAQATGNDQPGSVWYRAGQRELTIIDGVHRASARLMRRDVAFTRSCPCARRMCLDEPVSARRMAGKMIALAGWSASKSYPYRRARRRVDASCRVKSALGQGIVHVLVENRLDVATATPTGGVAY